MITPDPIHPLEAMKHTCVHCRALEIDGVRPQPGDEIEYTGRGRVQRIDGDRAYFSTDYVNGESVGDGGEAGGGGGGGEGGGEEQMN